MALSLFLPALALAADRHVYLDVNADGQIQDCPNPAHNAKGTSNTDEMSYCVGGTSAGKVIGTVTGTVSNGTCTGGGGVVTNLTNGVSADMDRDGTNEAVYGHPQACVYNAAPSDSCEIHAGTYSVSGATCESDCGRWAGLTTCEDGDCFFASVLIYGEGPNKTRTAAFGTAGSPFYLRGAVMNASTDTWDSDADKTPDTVGGEPTSYPAILSGDRNTAGFQATDCVAGSCTGDAFYAIQVGCGSPDASFGNYLCQKTGLKTAGTHNPFIDSDANGSFDLEVGTNGVGNVDFVVIKDLEFTGYNGGATAAKVGTTGPRYWAGSFALGADGDGEGIVIDHIYTHGNDYSTETGEYDWATFADSSNQSCGTSGSPGQTIVKNSYLEQNNEKLYNTDCGLTDPCGCPPSIHDNRILVNITSSRARNGSSCLAYFKPFETQYLGLQKQYLVYNNEIVIRQGGFAGNGWSLFDLGGFTTGDTDGAVWFYGNVVRNEVGYVNSVNAFWDLFDLKAVGGDVFSFNNTIDLDGRAEYRLTTDCGCVLGTLANSDCPDDVLGGANSCLGAGPSVFGTEAAGSGIFADRNNFRLGLTGLYRATATTLRRGYDLPCDTAFPGSCTSSTTPLNVSNRGTYLTSAALVGVNAGLAAYAPVASGPLDGVGTCDPDGDGTAGVDYDGDRVNDTSWNDLAGNLVYCPAAGTVTDMGALQNDSDTIPVTSKIRGGQFRRWGAQ